MLTIAQSFRVNCYFDGTVSRYIFNFSNVCCGWEGTVFRSGQWQVRLIHAKLFHLAAGFDFRRLVRQFHRHQQKGSLFIAVLSENFQLTMSQRRKEYEVSNENYENPSKLSRSDLEVFESPDHQTPYDRSFLNIESFADKNEQCKEFQETKTNGRIHSNFSECTDLFFATLPLVEKSYQVYHDRSACHDRIISYVIDDLNDIPNNVGGD